MKPDFSSASESFKQSNPHLFAADTGGDYACPKAVPDPPSREDVKSEKILQTQIEQYLGHKGITAIRSRMDKRTSNQVGTPDFMFAVEGQACAYEAKLPHHKLSAEQEEMRVKLESDGWHYVVINHLDMVIADLHFLRKIPV